MGQQPVEQAVGHEHGDGHAERGDPGGGEDGDASPRQPAGDHHQHRVGGERHDPRLDAERRPEGEADEDGRHDRSPDGEGPPLGARHLQVAGGRFDGGSADGEGWAGRWVGKRRRYASQPTVTAAALGRARWATTSPTVSPRVSVAISVVRFDTGSTDDARLASSSGMAAIGSGSTPTRRASRTVQRGEQHDRGVEVEHHGRRRGQQPEPEHRRGAGRDPGGRRVEEPEVVEQRGQGHGGQEEGERRPEGPERIGGGGHAGPMQPASWRPVNSRTFPDGALSSGGARRRAARPRRGRGHRLGARADARGLPPDRRRQRVDRRLGRHRPPARGRGRRCRSAGLRRGVLPRPAGGDRGRRLLHGLRRLARSRRTSRAWPDR